MTGLKFALVAAALSWGGLASAATIDFSSVTPGQYSTVTVGDYVFTRINGQDPVVFAGASGINALGDDDSDQGNGSVFTITRADGGFFTVSNLVFGATTDAAASASARIDLGDYETNRTIVVVDGQPYAGDMSVLTNTSSLFVNAYTPVGAVGIRSFDATAVPEPATWGLMIVGCGAIGTMARRRRRTLAVA